MKINHHFFKLFTALSLVLFVVSCDETNTTTDNSDNSTVTTTNTTTNNGVPKTDAEVIAENIARAAELVLKEKHKKDSVRDANREQKWAFQIGESLKNEKTLIAEFKKYKHIRNICVFKCKGDYLIIKKDDQPRELLNDSLGNVKSQVGPSVKIIDLLAECPKRKTISQDSPIRDKKEDIEIKCFVCDK